MLTKKNFLGVAVTNATEKEVLEYIVKTLREQDEKYYIVTPNPEILVFAAKHKAFQDILNQARIALCDGIGVVIGGQILGISFKGRATGTDLVKNLCKEVSEKPITVGFLGGGPRIAEITAECLQSQYPSLKIVFVGEEWDENGFKTASGLDLRFKNKDLRINPREKIVNHKSYFINRPQIDILFVAFGFPKQEEWMAKNVEKLPVKVMIGVGGAFDYISGRVARAPSWLRALGFEWLYRLIRQPWRIKRQLALLEFAYFVLKERVGSKVVV